MIGFPSVGTHLSNSLGTSSSGSIPFSPEATSLMTGPTPAESLYGVMNGMTLVAAVSGSPALARVCSHPAFAAASLGLGAYFQYQAAGQTQSLIAGGLLALSAAGTAVNAYSFYRGLKAGWQSLHFSTQLAVYDRVRDVNLPPEVRAAIVEARNHWADLKDERPERIAAAVQSSFRGAAPEQAASTPHLFVRERRLEAEDMASGAARHATDAAWKTSPDAEKMLRACAPEGSAWDRLIVLRDAPGHLEYVRRSVLHAEEAQRVASASPRNWVSEARGDASYAPWQKTVGEWLGRNVQGALLYGIPAFVTLQVLAGGLDYAQGQLAGEGFFKQIVHSLLGLAPAAATYLYNARQGSRRFNVSPAAHQEIVVERFLDPELQKRTVERLASAVPPLEPGESARYAEQCRVNLDRVESQIAVLESLEIPIIADRAEVSSGAPAFLKENDRVRKFTPIRVPDPKRPYRYDHRPNVPDTEERKRIRTEIKAMPIVSLEEAIRAGRVTHVDIYNMIRDHSVSKDGAVITRPLEGKLGRKLLRLAQEADRKGEIRHFTLVKDLFEGIDGVVTAGSKTMHLTDFGKSPLVQRLVDQGFVPIPCGLTAGANGPDGLYNGHGAVGNSKKAGYDTAGSSSAEAYALGLKDFPIRLAIGTDTGGSITAPCGAMELFGWIPEPGTVSRANMIPYATHLDTPGVMGVDKGEVLNLARLLTLSPYQSRFDESPRSPALYYFESNLQLASEKNRERFDREVKKFRLQGLSATALDERFSAYRTIPLDLYADSYAAAAMALMNPLQENARGEPQRYILDRRLQMRMGRAHALLMTPDEKHGNLFNRYLHLHVRFRELFQKKFPAGFTLITPAPEAVALEDFIPNGPAGALLDRHDQQGGMLKNRVYHAAFVDAERGMVIEGKMEDVLAVSLTEGTAAFQETLKQKIGDKIKNIYPKFAERRFGEFIDVLIAEVRKRTDARGISFDPSDVFEEAKLDQCVGDVVKMAVTAIQKQAPHLLEDNASGQAA